MNIAVKSLPPQQHDVKVRRIHFEFTDDIPEFWYDGDPVRTLLLAALSGGFPDGERFFIDSVRQFQDRVTDPELREAIRGFIGQEAHHGKEHKDLNVFLARHGYPIARIEKTVAQAMNVFRKYLSPERQLAQTAAVEHFTALLAEQYLLGTDELDKMDARMAPIWAWHAIEESEHKAVAFDVYKATVDDEWIRVSQMMITTALFLGFSTVDFLDLMRRSGHMRDWKMWLRSANHFWGRPGLFRKMIPAYLDYYRRDFHPWQHDSRSLLAKAKKKYLGDWA